jgi:hypothetical protein
MVAYVRLGAVLNQRLVTTQVSAILPLSPDSTTLNVLAGNAQHKICWSSGNRKLRVWISMKST